jgi:DNA-directed RNA polymerase alpha subunit
MTREEELQWLRGMERELRAEIAALYKRLAPIEAKLSDILQDASLIQIDDLELTVRASNIMRNANIRTLADLMKYTPTELLKLNGMGRKSLNELRYELQSRGLNFATKEST